MRQTVQGVQTAWLELDIAGSPMECYVAKPNNDTGRWPAVIVFMEIFGVNSHIREVTERLAGEGYVAIAPNYYHRTTRNLELGYNEADMAIGRKHKEQTTRDGLLVDIRAVIEHLQDDPQVRMTEDAQGGAEKIGCIGFCFGGHVAFIAAGFDEVAASACFYPGGVATASPGGGPATVTHAGEINGEILCLFGDEDPLISHEDTATIEAALQRAGVRHEIVRYSNVGHGFFCNQRADYDAAAAADAWNRVRELFTRNLPKVE